MYYLVISGVGRVSECTVRLLAKFFYLLVIWRRWRWMSGGREMLLYILRGRSSSLDIITFSEVPWLYNLSITIHSSTVNQW